MVNIKSIDFTSFLKLYCVVNTFLLTITSFKSLLNAVHSLASLGIMPRILPLNVISTRLSRYIFEIPRLTWNVLITEYLLVFTCI